VLSSTTKGTGGTRMLRRLDTKVILVAVAAFLIIKGRATYLLVNLLELKDSPNARLQTYIRPLFF
jgi:hypothetical protein